MNALTEQLTQEAISLLKQLSTVISSLDDQTYASHHELLSGASIGAHVRHTLEFFECLQKCPSSKEINYDLRQRNPELEVSRRSAMNFIDQLSDGFRFSSSATNLQLVSQGADGSTRQMTSSLDRELWYTIEHAIHHMAIIKIGILHAEPNFTFPQNFGIASSTVIYQQLQD